jgi:uncharacterized protein YbjT (DUF2867 family)
VKVVVIGGTGLIGSKVVARLAAQGHEAIPASPRLGIDTITGEGLAPALEGASVVVDVSNSPNLEYATALSFFETSTTNLLAAEKDAGVGHHVALSVVGTRTLSESGDPETTTAGYSRAKLAQETRIAASAYEPAVVGMPVALMSGSATTSRGSSAAVRTRRTTSSNGDRSGQGQPIGMALLPRVPRVE